jgi:hypothetical protein
MLPDHESDTLKALEDIGMTPKYIDFSPNAEDGAILNLRGCRRRSMTKRHRLSCPNASPDS